MNNLIASLTLVSLILFAQASPSLAQQEEPSVTTQSLRGPLHLLQGRGGNVVASVGMDGVLLIDNDYAEFGPAYEKAIGLLTQSDLAPGFIVNTHWHGDHTGNNEFWGLRGSILVAHDNVRKRLNTTQRNEALDMTVEPSPAIALPIVTFADSLVLHFNGGDVEVRHFPAGHTDGDSVVFYLEQNVVHMGDHFFKDRFPFIDLESGGTLAGYIANVKKVLTMVDDQTLIVPGHGAVANKADLQRYLDMLQVTTADIAAALKKGKSVDAVVSAGLGKQWASWGEGFINEEAWIRTVAAGQ